MKILDGKELSGFVKERQAHVVRSLRARKIFPKLLILRNSDDLAISKYVGLKKRYGEDIGVEVEDKIVASADELISEIKTANSNPKIHGIIVQLPLVGVENVDVILQNIAWEKDVDGLRGGGIFYSATATAINWLLGGYDIDLENSRIAIVGSHGRLVGAPLMEMWTNSGYDVTGFNKGSDLNELKNFNVVVTATGVPRLIKSEMIAPGTTVVDAGTTSENGKLVGDVDEKIRERTDLKALTPIFGGVGPLTISCLFEAVLTAASKE